MAKYTTRLGDNICKRTANSSVGLRQICKDLGVAYSTVTGWIYNGDHELCAKYKRAKELQVQNIADEILELADNTCNDFMTVEKGYKIKEVLNRENIARSKMQISARARTLAKLAQRPVNSIITTSPVPF